MVYNPSPTLKESKDILIESGYDVSSAHDALEDIRAQLENQYLLTGAVRTCSACPLRASCKGRPVAGIGPYNASLMIVGDSPGTDDTTLAAPFVGASGMLLTLILNKLGISRNDVYITNVVKCGVGRMNITFEEMMSCSHHFFNELAVVQPKAILALGTVPLQMLTDNIDARITKSRGEWFTEVQSSMGIRVMPTYNPGYLLHSKGPKLKEHKRSMWNDIKEAAVYAGLI